MYLLTYSSIKIRSNNICLLYTGDASCHWISDLSWSWSAQCSVLACNKL